MGQLYKELKRYTDQVYPMHMPGHKAGRLGLNKELYSIDVTEVDGTDDLHDAESIIMEAQQRAAQLFGAEYSFFLVNGSTVGLMAAMTAVAGPDDQFLVARNCHRSVYDGMVTTGVCPIYIEPERTHGLIGGISPGKVREAIDRHPKVKGLILTSPTYEGFVSDIREIASILHAHGKVLIVDEAHGAHFGFHEGFPETALEMGADLVIQSTHKTLPSITQSAMLHMKSERVDVDKVKRALALYETSSPSYIMMVALDDCCEILSSRGQELFETYYHNLQELYTVNEELQHLKILTPEDVVGKGSIVDFDKGKIMMDLSRTPYSGREFDNVLRNKYNIQIEMATFQHGLAMTSIADSIEGFASFRQALIEIDHAIDQKNVGLCEDTEKATEKTENNLIQPDLVLTPRQAYFAEVKTVSLDESLNKVSGDYIIPYPPGIPLVAPGERISKAIIDRVKAYREKGLKVIGSQNIKIVEVE